MYLCLIQTVIIPEALCYILSGCFDRVFMCRQFSLSLTKCLKLSTQMKNFTWELTGLQLNIWKDQAQPSLGRNRVETINKFHTFSAAGAYPSMQRISFDVSIKYNKTWILAKTSCCFSLLTIFLKHNVLVAGIGSLTANKITIVCQTLVICVDECISL